MKKKVHSESEKVKAVHQLESGADAGQACYQTTEKGQMT